ncbi:hypothetical protein BSL78_06525 [Apostichopus japonicus]|uniref:Peptidase aspartic putative domain-containing protein n=1 Tax=Stichopus japonicus TaxID=307972 RepID=A0A2G8L8H4_STIJA|nr:hypothetical protein BSL78_06525 [Apostichopus japonicus]
MPIHNRPHPLKKCRTFRNKDIEQRRTFLKEAGICFKCCASSLHIARDCEETIHCSDCGSNRHVTALHPGPSPHYQQRPSSLQNDGGEQLENTTASVASACTEVCDGRLGGRSCAKICMVKVYPENREAEAMKVYAVMDEQSNGTLAKSQLFDQLNLQCNTAPYTLRTCSGTTETTGRAASNLFIESLDGSVKLRLPTVRECELIPDDRKEIPSPAVARHHPHLKQIADKIPAVDPDVPILLLLGRDILRVHKVRDQINGSHEAPYAQCLDLGWVIVGETCLGTAHRPSNTSVFKTNVLRNGRPSYYTPCTNSMSVSAGYKMVPDVDVLGQSVFQKTKDDEKQAASIEDLAFLNLMDKEVHQDKTTVGWRLFHSNH